jgi:type IX secretion system PorP/SprF family membrane protein
MNRKLLSCTLLIFATYFLAKAQDIHFSQFYNAPVNINPALTGAFQGDTRYTANFRNQWRKVPVNYLTFAGTYDTKLRSNILKFGELSVGGHFHYDSAGDSNFYNSQLAGLASLSKTITSKDRLSLGLSVGVTFLGFDYSDLRFNSQFDGEIFTPDLASGEGGGNVNENMAYLDMNIGLNWRHEVKKSRSFFNVGMAAMHFNSPNVNFYNNRDESLDIRVNVFINGAIELTRKLDLRARTLAQKKGPEQQFLVGLAGRYFIDPNLAKETSIELGVNYRFFDFGDAWSPTLELNHKSMTIGLSYDVNVSDFNVATQNRGAFEVALIYRTAREPDPKPKDCKIF